MQNSDLLVISGQQVNAILRDQEREIIRIIRQTYEAHSKGQTSLPFSTFLRFPNRPPDRIIGLPAFVDGDKPIAGMKWVSSFPENVKQGIERASAVIALNNMQTGRPFCILEGSHVNAARTAASAAIAAQLLLRKPTNELTLIGCGPINRTVARFIKAVMPEITRLGLYDTDKNRAKTLAQMLAQELAIETVVYEDLASGLRDKTLISIATNVATPYIDQASYFSKNSLVLHISLRDIAPDIILSCNNVVDDIDHVNRENTSIHLASQKNGTTDFINATIGEISRKVKSAPNNAKPTIYSPFGLGILDIKLGQYIYDEVVAHKAGTIIPNFF
jgi:2,3-diaminopropionate biosynthesis protein SbnB